MTNKNKKFTEHINSSNEHLLNDLTPRTKIRPTEAKIHEPFIKNGHILASVSNIESRCEIRANNRASTIRVSKFSQFPNSHVVQFSYALRARGEGRGGEFRWRGISTISCEIAALDHGAGENNVDGDRRATGGRLACLSYTATENGSAFPRQARVCACVCVRMRNLLLRGPRKFARETVRIADGEEARARPARNRRLVLEERPD